MNARSVAAFAKPPRRRLTLASPALAIAAVAMAGAGSVALAADAAVSIANLAFAPATVTVNVGDSVTWTNLDQVAHTATANGGSFNTGAFDAGQSRSVTFNTAGSFPYFCSIHPQMTGTVVVQAVAATPAPTPTPPPAATSAPGATPRGTTPPTNAVNPSAAGQARDAGVMATIFLAAVAAFAIAHRRAVWPLR